MTTGENRTSILLVDDSPDDRLFMRMSVSKSKKLKIVAEVNDGLDAIDYLLGNRHFVDRTKYPLPDIVLLDLKMPRMNGFELLDWIRHRYSQELLVVMVSGSWLREDIDKSIELGATAYFKKTAVRVEQAQMIQGIESLLSKNTGSSTTSS